MESEQKITSLSTVLALYHNMLGGALLSFPLLFRDSGLISSTLVIMISALISFATCRIYILHTRHDQKCTEESILRITGKRGQQQFRFITGVYIIFLNIIYLDLIVDQLYSIIFFFFDMKGATDSIAHKDSLQFGKFSIQWLTIVLFLPLLGLLSIKKVSFLVKMCYYGSAAIFIYMAYVIYQFFLQLSQGTIIFDQITWFSFDIGSLAGTSSIAFTVHAFVVPFMKQNKIPQNNERDLGITYLIGFITYEVVSVLGALAVTGKDCKNTFVDCYLTEWTILIVEVTFFLGRITAFPIMVEVGRTRILQLFYGEVSNKQFVFFNAGFMLLASVLSIISPLLPLSTLMGFVGAFFCYFFVYLFPARIHFSCLYRQAIRLKFFESLLEQDLINSDSILKDQCNHSEDYFKSKSKLFRYVFYGGLNVIGLGVGVLGIYSTVESILNN